MTITRKFNIMIIIILFYVIFINISFTKRKAKQTERVHDSRKAHRKGVFTLLTIDQLNDTDHVQFIEILGGIFEHSPWIPEKALGSKPFSTFISPLQRNGPCC